MQKQSKQRVWIAIGIFAVFAMIVVVWSTIYFFRSTYTRDSIPAECARISAEGDRKAKLFVEHTSDDLPGYSLWVANDGDHAAPEELFIFREGKAERFYKVLMFDSANLHYEDAQPVGLILFAPRDGEDQKNPVRTAVFYSANEDRISLCRYTLKMNGIETTLEKEVYPGRDFIITVPGIGKKDGIEMKLMKASFYSADGSEVCTMAISPEVAEKIPSTA